MLALKLLDLFFNKQVKENDEPKVIVKVYVFGAPKGYHHMAEFKGESNEDKLNELTGIDNFLEIIKGIAIDVEKNKIIRLRKDQLIKSSSCNSHKININIYFK